MFRPNASELIIDEFWDPALSEIDRYRIETPESRCLTLNQRWAWVEGTWKNSSKRLIGRMSRDLNGKNVRCGYLLVSISLPRSTCLRILTSEGQREDELEILHAYGNDSISEFRSKKPLSGDVEKLIVELRSSSRNAGAFKLLWIGLTDRTGSVTEAQKALPGGQLKKYSSSYLTPLPKPDDHVPTKEFLFDQKDITSLKRRIEHEPFKSIYSQLKREASKYVAIEPSHLLKNHVWLQGRSPDFSRQKDREVPDICHAMIVLGFTSLIEKDQQLARKACEFAFILAGCSCWRETFMSSHPFSTWHHGAFTEALCVEALALVIDWCGSIINKKGLRFLVGSIYEKGIWQIERQFFKGNFYVIENPALYLLYPLILGALLVSEQWPNYRSRVRYWHKFFCSMFRKALLEDGGIRMPPGYWNKVTIPPVFMYTARRGYLNKLALDSSARLEKRFSKRSKLVSILFHLFFSRVTRLSLGKYYRHRLLPGNCVKPSKFRKYPNYLKGTIKPRTGSPQLIEVGDFTTSSLLADGVFLLARVDAKAGKDFWNRLANSYLTEVLESKPQAPLTKILALLCNEENLDHEKNIICRENPTSILLHRSCIFSSKRIHHDVPVFVTFLGAPSQAAHRHPDAGSFILEHGKEALLIDRGSLSYNHPLSNLVKRTEYHNAITPISDNMECNDQALDLDRDISIKMNRLGALGFHVYSDLRLAWPHHFKSYRRDILSETPISYTITDSIITKTPCAVAFHLHTPYQCISMDRKVVIICDNCKLHIQPCDAYQRIECSEDLMDRLGRPINHIVLATDSSNEHRLQVQIEIQKP